MSYDIWHWLGRGYAASMELLKFAEHLIMTHPDAPRVRWMILDGAIWTPANKSQPWLPAEDGSDAQHRKHGHVTNF